MEVSHTQDPFGDHIWHPKSPLASPDLSPINSQAFPKIFTSLTKRFGKIVNGERPGLSLAIVSAQAGVWSPPATRDMSGPQMLRAAPGALVTLRSPGCHSGSGHHADIL